jgi:hypothetical protein
MQTDKVCSFKLLLVCDGLLLLENKVICDLAAVFDAKLKHDRPWAFPKRWPLCTTLTLRTTLQGRVLSHAHPTRPSWSVALLVVRADSVPCDTVRFASRTAECTSCARGGPPAFLIINLLC